MLNARVRIIGGRNSPSVDDHIHFISTASHDEPVRPSTVPLDDIHVELGSVACPVSTQKIKHPHVTGYECREGEDLDGIFLSMGNLSLRKLMSFPQTRTNWETPNRGKAKCVL